MEQFESIEQLSQVNLEEIDPGIIETFLKELPDKAFHLGIRVLLVIVTFFIGVQIIRLMRNLIKRGLRKQKADESAIHFVDSFLKYALYAILIMLTASALGVDATSIVALVGSASVAVGLALQGSLSNLAGGVLLLIMKPFGIGDWIKDSNGNEGEVTSIDVFYTHLKTIDNRVVVLPNGTLANGSIMNSNREKKRRINIVVGISYEADIRMARNVLMKVLMADKGVLKEEAKRVIVDELGDNGVILNIHCYASVEEFWDTKWRLTEAVKYALDEAGIEIPYPQLDVHNK